MLYTYGIRQTLSFIRSNELGWYGVTRLEVYNNLHGERSSRCIAFSIRTFSCVLIHHNFFNFDFAVMCAEASNAESEVVFCAEKRKKSKEPFLLCVTVHTIDGKSILPSAYPYSSGMYVQNRCTCLKKYILLKVGCIREVFTNNSHFTSELIVVARELLFSGLAFLDFHPF